MTTSKWLKPGAVVDAPAAQRRRLAEQRAAVACGNLGGLIDALLEAAPAERGREPRPDDLLMVPRWATEAAAQAVGDLLSGRRPGVPKGRTASASARYVQDMLDLARFREVEAWRRTGLTRERAIRRAVESLAGTVLSGSEATLRNAVTRVAKRLKANPARYYECRHATVATLLAP